MKPGPKLGVTSEFALKEMVSVETGLLLSAKGYKVSGNETIVNENYEYSEKLNLLYLDIPITAKTYFNVKGAKIYGASGSYLG